jgi:hypothetical protein
VLLRIPEMLGRRGYLESILLEHRSLFFMETVLWRTFYGERFMENVSWRESVFMEIFGSFLRLYGVA